jgi:hypothetical protein
MGRVHRELLERFKRAQIGGNRSSQAVLKEVQQSGNARICFESPVHEIKQLLHDMQFYTKPETHAGLHLCDLLQVPDLYDIIVKEVECKKHFLRRSEKPKLKLLGLRYGVTEAAIRKCNGLEDVSVPIRSDLAFLYIPRSQNDEGQDDGRRITGLIPARITRSELTEKLRERSRSAD